jgi:hypothetical protein
VALADLKLPEHEIKTTGGSFTVRGLTLPDVAELFRVHATKMEMLFRQYAGSEDKSDDVVNASVDLLQAAPELACEVIALAAGEPNMVAKVVKLPFTVQIEALEAIGRMTFDAEGGPKKVIETVINVMAGLTDLSKDLRTAQTGSKE